MFKKNKSVEQKTSKKRADGIGQLIVIIAVIGLVITLAAVVTGTISTGTKTAANTAGTKINALNNTMDTKVGN